MILLKDLIKVSVSVSRKQKLWITTLSKRVNIPQYKLGLILIVSNQIANEGVTGEQSYETLVKCVGISRDKLDELNLVKKELRIKQIDQNQHVQYVLQKIEENKPIKSMSQIIRLLIDIDMLDLESKADILAKLNVKEMGLELKHLKDSNDMFENTLPSLRNKSGA